MASGKPPPSDAILYIQNCTALYTKLIQNASHVSKICTKWCNFVCTKCIPILYSDFVPILYIFLITILYKMYADFVCWFCILILYTYFCIIMSTKSVQNKCLVYRIVFVYTFCVQNRYSNFKNMQNWIPKFIHSCKFCSHINDKVCRVYPVPSCRPSGASTRHELYRHPSLSSME